MKVVLSVQACCVSTDDNKIDCAIQQNQSNVLNRETDEQTNKYRDVGVIKRCHLKDVLYIMYYECVCVCEEWDRSQQTKIHTYLCTIRQMVAICAI